MRPDPSPGVVLVGIVARRNVAALTTVVVAAASLAAPQNPESDTTVTAAASVADTVTSGEALHDRVLASRAGRVTRRTPAAAEEATLSWAAQRFRSAPVAVPPAAVPPAAPASPDRASVKQTPVRHAPGSRRPKRSAPPSWPGQAPKRAAARPPAMPVAGSAGTVVSYALAQVGSRYESGAAGPNGFDCSGLVLAAYARIGVALPHSSNALGRYGRPVSRAELQPGDLILYGGHVGIALGGGWMVHAARPGRGVLVAPIYGNPIDYRRLIG